MSLEYLKSALQAVEAQALNRRMSVDAWVAEQTVRGEKVALFRNYIDGDHRAELSAEMIAILRIDSKSANRFNDNYCPRVVYTMSDRLKVARVESDTDAANEWLESVLAANRFDGLQTDVHEASLIDGDAFVMVSWDKENKRVALTNEPAWDGTSGMMVLHDPQGTVQIAVKSWRETVNSVGDTTRVNVYLPDRIRRYISQSGGALQPFKTDEQDWETLLLVKGEPMGCPVVHFKNRWRVGDFYGLSEIEQVIPLQDSLNRTMTSLIMAAELTAFQVKVALSFEPPAAIAPGSWITITNRDVDTGIHEPKAYVLETGQVVPYIQAADWLVGQIGRVSDTPMPEHMGADNASGESLKQRESGLLGKVSRYQVRNGNKWEDVITLAARVEAAFGSTPPAFETISCKWDAPEVRNDKEVIENAQVLEAMGYHEEALRQMAPVFDWDETKIQELLSEKQATQARNFAALIGNQNLPTYENVSIGANN